MSFKATTELLNVMLNAAQAALDGGFFYGFAGPVPTYAADPLDMGEHTQVFKLSIDGDGSTGLTLEEADSAQIIKPAGDEWKGLIAFDGAEDGETTLTPTFFRFCPAGDDGRDAATDVRLQGTLGGPSSGADVELESATVTANGSNDQTLDSFSVNLSSLA